MPKIKALIMFSLVIALSFSLIGCGLIASQSTETEEVIETGGQVPGWLLLSHRSVESPESEIDDELAAIDEDEEVEEVEEDEITVAEAAEGSSQSTQQTNSTGHQVTEKETEETESSLSLVERMKQPGPERIHYLQHKLPGESEAEFIKRAQEAQEEAEKDNNDGGWMNGRNDDDDDDDNGSWFN